MQETFEQSKQQIHDVNELRLLQMARAVVCVLVGGYALVIFLSILPFFAYGLHLEDPLQVASGAFDPRNYPVFDHHFWLGNLAHIMAISSFATIPFWATPLSGILGFLLIRFGRKTPKNLRVVTLVTIMIGIGLSIFYFTPFARLLLIWHMD